MRLKCYEELPGQSSTKHAIEVILVELIVFSKLTRWRRFDCRTGEEVKFKGEIREYETPWPSTLVSDVFR